MKLIALVSLLFVVSCSTKKATPEDLKLLTEMKESYEVLPTNIINKELEADKIALGKKLYFEKKLSINDTISCNSCHNLDGFGVDNEPTSPGHDGRRGDRNSPTSLNSATHIAQFWDGRAATVEDQAIGPILNPIEHGLPNEAAALKKIDTKEYRALFAKAFPKAKKSFTYKNIGRAIGAFEKTLFFQSRFDRYLQGDVFAISTQEKAGMKKFESIGCTSCHDGATMGGNQYQKLGAVEPYKTEDKGRYNVTKDEDDMHVFKVPSLRNITKTYPYFHDGSIKTLDEAIRIMAKHQLGEKVSDQDVADISAFLGALTAENVEF
jgi:cytochrome c peroxidase